ncbi:MAG: kinase inhibitor [Rhizobiaceae bacterium]|nr:kinase inhibitor [Rhizobiaceae bacterium]
MSFSLTSKDIRDGHRLPEAQVLNGMGYSGGNTSPHLAWSGAPAGTRSFVVTCYDPDAPTGSGWWHWVVANIPAETRELPTGAGGTNGALPSGALQTRTDFGSEGYGGAAPPPGPAHRYIFTVHALKVDTLELDANASPALVGFMVHMNTLGKAEIVTVYGAS